MIQWPEAVVDSIARRRCVLFLGAGASANSVGEGGAHPPSWKTFMDAALDQCPSPKKHIKAYLSQGDMLSACELLKHKLGDRWTTLLRQKFVDPKFTHAAIHEHVFALDTKIVVTPNFDKIYDTYASTASASTVMIKSYADDDLLEVVSGSGRYILKIHGDIDTPNGLVFSRSQYARSRAERPGVYRLVEAMMLSNAFLFIGCGTSDPDIALLLENYRFEHKYSTGHYILLPKPVHQDTAGLLKSTRNLNVLVYDPKDNHKALTDSLKELVSLVEARREEIALTRGW